MPAKSLKSMADEYEVSYESAERYWKQAKEQTKEQGFKENGTKKEKEDFYKYVMGIVEKRLKYSSDNKKKLESYFEESSNKIKNKKDFLFGLRLYYVNSGEKDDKKRKVKK